MMLRLEKLTFLIRSELDDLFALHSLKILHKTRLLNIFFSKFEDKDFQFLGLTFKNRLGTAAGLDKNGDYIDCLGDLGFGFLEVGTVTVSYTHLTLPTKRIV